ncbi:MAG: IclR family transcriptional regulator [Deltaproteobacteria bacterium]|nr:IclR family transcriptional regulator [Deltaproteobacteria bacterium]
MKNKPKKYTALTLEKGLYILEYLSKAKEEKSCSEICEGAGLNVSTTYRILTVMENMGYLNKNKKNSKYFLGMKLINLGSLALHRFNIRLAAAPLLSVLAKETKTHIYLSVLDNYHALCIVSMAPENISYVTPIRVGRRFLLDNGAGPKTILAQMQDEDINFILTTHVGRSSDGRSKESVEQIKKEVEQIRLKNYALCCEEIEEGVSGLACPVVLEHEEIVASLCMVGLSWRFSDEFLTGLLNKLLDTARQLEERLSTS